VSPPCNVLERLLDVTVQVDPEQDVVTEVDIASILTEVFGNLNVIGDCFVVRLPFSFVKALPVVFGSESIDPGELGLLFSGEFLTSDGTVRRGAPVFSIRTGNVALLGFVPLQAILSLRSQVDGEQLIVVADADKEFVSTVLTVVVYEVRDACIIVYPLSVVLVLVTNKFAVFDNDLCDVDWDLHFNWNLLGDNLGLAAFVGCSDGSLAFSGGLAVLDEEMIETKGEKGDNRKSGEDPEETAAAGCAGFLLSLLFEFDVAGDAGPPRLYVDVHVTEPGHRTCRA